jgi:hypothetical protein
MEISKGSRSRHAPLAGGARSRLQPWKGNGSAQGLCGPGTAHTTPPQEVLCYILIHMSAVSTLLSTRSSRRPVHVFRRPVGGGFCRVLHRLLIRQGLVSEAGGLLAGEQVLLWCRFPVYAHINVEVPWQSCLLLDSAFALLSQFALDCKRILTSIAITKPFCWRFALCTLFGTDYGTLRHPFGRSVGNSMSAGDIYMCQTMGRNRCRHIDFNSTVLYSVDVPGELVSLRYGHVDGLCDNAPL